MPNSAFHVPPLAYAPVLCSYQHWLLFCYGDEEQRQWAFNQVVQALWMARRNSGVYFGPNGA